MPSTLTTFDNFQLGRETTKGTAVAQTTRWVGEGMVEVDAPKNWARTQNGIMIARSQRGAIASQMAKLKLNSDLTFEQILYIMNMGFTGLTTGTGAGADKTWQFTPSVIADPALNTFTVGYRKTDGTTNWDERIAYVFAESWEISAAIGENAKISAECVGRPIEIGTAITGAVAVPTVNYVPTSLFKVYINVTLGAIGTTQKTGTVVSFKLSYKSPYQAKMYMDGRTDLSFSSYGLKDVEYDLELQCEFTADMLTEQQKADDNPGSLRYIRLDATGAALGSSNYQIQIDGAFEYENGGFDVDGDRDGSATCTLKLVGSYDVTNSLGLKVKCVNALASLT